MKTKDLIMCDGIQLIYGDPVIGQSCYLRIINPHGKQITQEIRTSQVRQWSWGYPHGNRILIETENSVYVGEKL